MCNSEAQGVHVRRVIPHHRRGSALASDAARPCNARREGAAAVAHEDAATGRKRMGKWTPPHRHYGGVADVDFIDVAGKHEVRFERRRILRHIAWTVHREPERIASALHAAPERPQVKRLLVWTVSFWYLLHAIRVSAGVGDEVSSRLARGGGEVDGKGYVHVPVVRA